MRKFGICAVFILVVFIAVPSLVTYIFSNGGDNKEVQVTPADLFTDPLASQDEMNSFESYITGVVAAEMPALYDIEALKAQAVASRTYALNYISRTNDYNYMNIGQAYISLDEMKSRWGDNFNLYYNKIAGAVKDTENEIIVYDGEPIVAVFHAFSGGRTENSENVWKEELPYLKSVDSSFDSNAKDFITKVEFGANDFLKRLRAEFEDISFGPGDIIEQIVIDEYTDAGYVKQVTIGNKTISGTELRQILGLKSANFTVYRELDKIVFETRGYGHGAGMSQVGANYLAGNGYDYKGILSYYYNDVAIEKTDNWK